MMGSRSFWPVLALCLAALFSGSALGAAVPKPAPTSTPAPGSDPTRRAFVVGVQRYQDARIEQLRRSDTDAADVAADLEQVGFDGKNVTLLKDIATKADFNKKLADFLATVKEGDAVLFYFSGHGAGVQASGENYLLPGGLKSLYAYTRDQMLPGERSNANLIALKTRDFQGSYEADEIAGNGASVTDIMAMIAQKKPRIAILVLDACRSLAPSEASRNALKRGADSGSPMLAAKDLPANTIVLYSADFGQEAIESFGPGDKRRNSLYTEQLRSEMQRPGQTVVGLAKRMAIVVRALADKGGLAQEPVYYANLADPDAFKLVDSIGAERFPPDQAGCNGSELDWSQISLHPQRRELERHRSLYSLCATAEKARRALVNLLSAADGPARGPSNGKAADACDALAADPNDPNHPPEAAGVAASALAFDEAIPACNASVKNNPRIPRFLFNLGRSEAAAANALDENDPARAGHLLNAKADFSDAAAKGYVAALYSLATLFDYSAAADKERESARKYLKQAADQGYAPALYELGLREMEGTFGEPRDPASGYELVARAAEKSVFPAMNRAAQALWYGTGVEPNPRRAVAMALLAADFGNVDAMDWLGFFYSSGRKVSNGAGVNDAAKTVQKDSGVGLVWFARAALSNDPAAERVIAKRMIDSEGLPSAQPEIAERYFRLAANDGDEEAEIELARRLIAGKVLVKPENGSNEAFDLLNRALSHNSARAALELAKVYRAGLANQAKDPKKAVQFAFRAMDLAVQSDPSSPDGDPFNELEAGILLSEMAVSGQANDEGGRPLLTQDETDRLERYYGRVDRSTMKVKIRRLSTPLDCGAGWVWWKNIWVWDWGRGESPTEPQFRGLEADTDCNGNKILRDTLTASFQSARKANVAFADLITQQIIAAKAATTAGKKK